MRRYYWVVMCALVASLGLAPLSQATSETSRIMSVYDSQGHEYNFLTQETTIGAALQSAGIALDERDTVEPARDEMLVASSYQVNIYRARPIIVTDGHIRLKVMSAHQIAARIATDAGLPLLDADTTEFSLVTNVAHDGAGQIMTITRARQVTLELHGKVMTLRTQAATLEQLLRDKSIELDESDNLSHPLDTPITEGLALRIWREGIQTISLDEEIAPPLRIIYDVNQPLGYRATQSEGRVGLRAVTYRVEIRDGHELSRVRLAAVTTREPAEATVVIGLRNDGQGLTLSRGAQHFVDSRGISHRETYYDLPMNVVMGACGQGGYYTVRPDGAKVDRDGYIIVAANYGNYPRCSLVETSLGLGKVYDTGGFAVRHPHGFDLATDWTNPNGR